MQGRRDLKEIRKRAFVKVREGIAEKLSSRDALILQSITMIDELDKCINILSERMREWYSFHFPELSNKVKEHKAYLRLISEGARENIPNPELKAIIEKSAGADFNEQDILMVQECARDVLSLYERRENMAKYLKELMETEVPNINSLVAANVGARLLNLAGGLENMSRMPAGTIQLLGAENALFRHLKTNAKPPKYGILFQLSEVNSAQKDRRGKVARAIAAKLAIASKVDFFSKRLEPSIKEKLDVRLKQIREKD